MTCDEFEELLGAYALGAVTPEEQEAARAHLAGCENCKRRLREVRAVVDLLPYSVTQMNPSDSLKERILEAIQKQDQTTSAQPVQINQRPRRRGWSTRLLAAAAVLLFILFGGMTAWNISLQHEVTSLQQQNIALERQVSSLQHQVALTYAIQGNPSAQGVTGKLIYLPEQNITLLVMQGLPQLPGTEVYQGWLIHDKQPRSIGLLNIENGIASVTYPGNITGYEVAAVSREPGPAASNNGPAGPVVAMGELKHAAIEYVFVRNAPHVTPAAL
jgi:anti-sigma-K factor RskA